MPRLTTTPNFKKRRFSLATAAQAAGKNPFVYRPIGLLGGSSSSGTVTMRTPTTASTSSDQKFFEYKTLSSDISTAVVTGAAGAPLVAAPAVAAGTPFFKAVFLTYPSNSAARNGMVGGEFTLKKLYFKGYISPGVAQQRPISVCVMIIKDSTPFLGDVTTVGDIFDADITVGSRATQPSFPPSVKFSLTQRFRILKSQVFHTYGNNTTGMSSPPQRIKIFQRLSLQCKKLSSSTGGARADVQQNGLWFVVYSQDSEAASVAAAESDKNPKINVWGRIRYDDPS